jgi:cell division protein FtsW (lipid II flippase)
LFAAMLMIMAGAFQAFAGLVAIFENEFYVATRNYLFQFDATTWGWIHLLVGLIVVMAGFAILAGRTWGRLVGITLDIFVICALAAHGRDVAASPRPCTPYFAVMLCDQL